MYRNSAGVSLKMVDANTSSTPRACVVGLNVGDEVSDTRSVSNPLLRDWVEVVPDNVLPSHLLFVQVHEVLCVKHSDSSV